MAHTDRQREILEFILDMVGDSDISSIKNVVTTVVRIINDPNSTAKALMDVIQIDPPLTAKVLRVANSAYYASRREISELQQAIVWIGFDALKELALSQKVCEIFKKTESAGSYSRPLLWKHSIAVALLAKMIYRREFGRRGEDVYVAGLLHDIGMIVEDQFFQDDFIEIINKSEQEKKNLTEVEYEVIGVSHADIGRAIMDKWQLPVELVSAIGSHHTPGKDDGQVSEIASTLHVADYLCQQRGIGYCDTPFPDRKVFEQSLQTIDVQPHALELIIGDVELELARMEENGSL